ncbi:primosomal protein N' [Actinomyces capricornis]|uniref:Probable replication restart protein PriA n=1 Tax=Actinomyces capricornis TaxID=2755559 RepID=A0ABM7UEN0_9ACTO|nr:primosomal protein N' [Actinomyces capricornis]BDA65568.1 putative primosomal protein N' [Actinomyces capricornis]
MGHSTGVHDASSSAPPPGTGPGEQGVLLAAPPAAQRQVGVPGVELPVARVVLDTVVPHLDRTFDYALTPELDQAAQPGTRVIVRFGGQEMRGWIWSRSATTTHLGALSPVRRVVSDLPVLPDATRRLIEAVAARGAGTRADVARLAVPPRHATTEDSMRHQPPAALPTWRRPSPEGTWEAYKGGPELLTDLARGGSPRAAWCALPPVEGVSASWIHCVAVAAQAVLASGRGVLVLVATTERAEAVAATMRRLLDEEDVVVLSAEHGPARRYRAFLKLLLGRARVVVGTRAAAFAPVHRLGLAVIWDDGDHRLDERHAPYLHARTVLELRSSLEGAGLILAGYSRSVETQGLVERGVCQDLEAPRELRRAAAARVVIPAAELDAEGASGGARIPSLAHRLLRRTLSTGPALIQVPRSGYAPVVACQACRRAARCAHCSGPLAMTAQKRAGCRWCARPAASWACPHCGGTVLRMVRVGSARTGEELGRAFPNTPVVVSGAREGHGVLRTVDASPRLVVATPGAEPVAEGGYGAVLILDGGVLSGRPELGATSEALRCWTNAAALCARGGTVMLLGLPDPRTSQALLNWNHALFARRELAEREELHLPPAWRTARLDGPPRAVEALLAHARQEGYETLGPVSVAPAAGPQADREAPSVSMSRALVRCPWEQGDELARALRLFTRERSVRRDEAVRIELDPTFLW